MKLEQDPEVRELLYFTQAIRVGTRLSKNDLAHGFANKTRLPWDSKFLLVRRAYITNW